MERIADYLHFWKQLGENEKRLLEDTASIRDVKKGSLLHGGGDECVGLLIVVSGRLRAYTISGEGKELTLYRLYERDICLFSASCMFGSLHMDLLVEAEVDTRLFHIPPEVYKRVMELSPAAAAYTNKLMAERFSDVMWLLDQVLNKKMDSRLAALLIEERENEGSNTLNITHERLGNHLGSVREVMTRMLKHFQEEGYVSLKRGSIELKDLQALRKIAEGSLR